MEDAETCFTIHATIQIGKSLIADVNDNKLALIFGLDAIFHLQERRIEKLYDPILSFSFTEKDCTLWQERHASK